MPYVNPWVFNLHRLLSSLLVGFEIKVGNNRDQSYQEFPILVLVALRQLQYSNCLVGCVIGVLFLCVKRSILHISDNSYGVRMRQSQNKIWVQTLATLYVIGPITCTRDIPYVISKSNFSLCKIAKLKYHFIFIWLLSNHLTSFHPFFCI